LEKKASLAFGELKWKGWKQREIEQLLDVSKEQ